MWIQKTGAELFIFEEQQKYLSGLRGSNSEPEKRTAPGPSGSPDLPQARPTTFKGLDGKWPLRLGVGWEELQRSRKEVHTTNGPSDQCFLQKQHVFCLVGDWFGTAGEPDPTEF